MLVAHRLDLNGRAAGLSRGAYLMRLIDDAPPVIPRAERAAGFAALNASASELALLSRDINHLRISCEGAPSLPLASTGTCSTPWTATCASTWSSPRP